MAKRTVADVVLLSDSDDEDIGVVRRGGGGGAFRRRSASLMENRQVSSAIADTTVTRRETLECRSFWKAGDNFVIPRAVTPTAPGMLEHARVHPKFLHSNATSHKWAFGGNKLRRKMIDQLNKTRDDILLSYCVLQQSLSYLIMLLMR